MKQIKIEALKDQVSKLKAELEELEAEFPRWNPDNPAGAKLPRSIARRIVLSAQHLEALVKEKTYTPGT